MVLSAGDHVVADSSSLVGSIGVVFQKMKVKGLLDHFNVDHKHIATNEYLKSYEVNYCTPSFRLTKMLMKFISSI